MNVLRRLRSGDSLLTRGVHSRRAIGWLITGKGYEHITVFHYRISAPSIVCGRRSVNFLEFLGISFSFLVATCSCDLGTLCLNDFAWDWAIS